MLAPWRNPGANSPQRRSTAKTSMQRAYDVHSPRRVKNEKQSGGPRQTVQEPLRIPPEEICRVESPRCSERGGRFIYQFACAAVLLTSSESSNPQVSIEKIKRALPRQLGRRFVVPRSCIVMETVIDPFINVRGVGH